MSSVKWPTPSRADVEQALTNVAEDCFYAAVDLVEADIWTEAGAAHEEWLEAHVAFTGPWSGGVRCRLPRAAARNLAAAFLGATDDEVDLGAPAVLDFAGELANMICGRWLTLSHPDALFSLDAPQVTQCVPDPSEEWQLALVNDDPLAVQITVGEPQ